MTVFAPASLLFEGADRRYLLHRLGIEIEEFRRVAAQDIALRLLVQEGQIIDHAGQIEIPMRIVRRIHELRFRIDHAEGAFQRFHILNFHRLRRIEHVAHIIRRLLLQKRRFGGAHHIFVVEALHQAIGPGQPAFDPHDLQLGEAFGQTIHHPVRHMHHVEPHEAQRMHTDEVHALSMKTFTPAEWSAQPR